MYVYLDMLTETDEANARIYAFPVDFLGTRWNGFASPGFTKAQADLLILTWNTIAERRRETSPEHDRMEPAEYDAERDLYRFIYDASACDPEERYETYLNERGLYHIGAWCWTWQTIERDDSEAALFAFLDAPKSDEAPCPRGTAVRLKDPQERAAAAQQYGISTGTVVGQRNAERIVAFGEHRVRIAETRLEPVGSPGLSPAKAAIAAANLAAAIDDFDFACDSGQGTDLDGAWDLLYRAQTLLTQIGVRLRSPSGTPAARLP